MEEWRDVEGFDGQYQVSRSGKIKRLKGVRHAGPSGLATVPEKVWLGYVDSQGYYSVSLSKTKKTTVHRLVCRAFHGPPPEGKTHVAHWDGEKLNNTAENLRWVNHLENSADERRLGRTMFGEKAWKARLTREEVLAIRDEYAAYEGRRGAFNQIAVRRGLERSHVAAIVRRKLWADI